jgi:hypothetical protein
VITAYMPRHFEGDIALVSSVACDAPTNDN